MLWYGSPASTGTTYEAFYLRMRNLGYVEGRNVSYEGRWPPGSWTGFPRWPLSWWRCGSDSWLNVDGSHVRSRATLR
jgi:hypothetical protein